MLVFKFPCGVFSTLFWKLLSSSKTGALTLRGRAGVRRHLTGRLCASPVPYPSVIFRMTVLVALVRAVLLYLLSSMILNRFLRELSGLLHRTSLEIKDSRKYQGSLSDWICCRWDPFQTGPSKDYRVFVAILFFPFRSSWNVFMIDSRPLLMMFHGRIRDVCSNVLV